MRAASARASSCASSSSSRSESESDSPSSSDSSPSDFPPSDTTPVGVSVFPASPLLMLLDSVLGVESDDDEREAAVCDGLGAAVSWSTSRLESSDGVTT